MRTLQTPPSVALIRSTGLFDNRMGHTGTKGPELLRQHKRPIVPRHNQGRS
jgi:hypothetical protein